MKGNFEFKIEIQLCTAHNLLGRIRSLCDWLRNLNTLVFSKGLGLVIPYDLMALSVQTKQKSVDMGCIS